MLPSQQASLPYNLEFLLSVEAWKYANLMGPLSCVAGQIIRFTDDSAFSICSGPSCGGGGAGGATGNNKTNWRNSWLDSILTNTFYHVKLWSSQLWMQFLQLRRESWKIQGFEPVTSRFWCDGPTKWTMKSLTMAIAKIAYITEKVIASLDFKSSSIDDVFHTSFITQFSC